MFTLAVDAVDLSSEEVVEALISGDFEVYPAVIDGKSLLTYRLFAENSYDAVLDAVGHLQSLLSDAVARRIEPDLVSVSDIASRLGRPRESIRAWVIGTRGPGGFPSALALIGGGIRVWDWPSVNEWLKQHDIDGHDQETLLSREEVDELNVMLRRHARKDSKKTTPHGSPTESPEPVSPTALLTRT